MIPRHLTNYLLTWKDRPDRKPLIIRGARQVGKTTMIREFANNFDQFLYLNLEVPLQRRAFEEVDDVDLLVQRIFLEAGLRLDQKSTLIFIDEIQASVRAIKQLRFFYENYPQLHVIAAGSLLEHALHKVQSFPVGRVEYAVLYPLNFQEYLLGLREDVAHDALLQIPAPNIAHARLTQLFHQYALIGGMPEAVDLFVTTNDFTQLGRIYESVITGYKDDVVKYARTKEEQQLIVHAIEASPLEAGLRIKFAGFGASNYRSREMSESLRTLVKSRLIHLIYPTTMTSPPAKPDKKKSPLLQFLDTGLLNYSLGLQSQILGVEDLNHIHKGIVIEHLVRQEMISIHHEPSFELSFWVRQKPTSNAATDSLITIDKYLIPVEIKSGSVGHLRSLHEYMDACNHPYAIRMHGGEFSVHTATTTRGKQYYLMNLPYYLGTLVNKYAQWFIDHYPVKSVEAISHPQA